MGGIFFNYRLQNTCIAIPQSRFNKILGSDRTPKQSLKKWGKFTAGGNDRKDYLFVNAILASKKGHCLPSACIDTHQSTQLGAKALVAQKCQILVEAEDGSGCGMYC
jgi:hypothetical protein